MSWNDDDERILDIGSGSGDVTVTLLSQVIAIRTYIIISFNNFCLFVSHCWRKVLNIKTVCTFRHD